MTVVVLFDIDGTMLLANGAGRRSVHIAMREVFGIEAHAHHPFDGKTDPQIISELASMAGVDTPRIEAEMTRALDRYFEHLRDDIARTPETVVLLPGVMRVLAALRTRSDVLLGVLTGNIEAGALLKLEAVEIDPAQFRVGAYGSDAPVRPALPAIAQARASALLGAPVPGHRIVIIGDTPHDLTCGNGIGARAIGVETGRFRDAELQRYNPLAVFADLSDTHAVVSAVMSVAEEHAAS
jgi:phosphoglycolate phosphatase